MQAHLESLITSYLLHGQLGVGLLKNLIQLASERLHTYRPYLISTSCSTPPKQNGPNCCFKPDQGTTSNTFSVSSGILLSWAHPCRSALHWSSVPQLSGTYLATCSSAFYLSSQMDSHGWPRCVHGDFRPGQKCNVVAGSRSNRFIGMSPANCSAGSF